MRASLCFGLGARGYYYHGHAFGMRSLYRSTLLASSGLCFLFLTSARNSAGFRLCASAPLRLVSSALRLCAFPLLSAGILSALLIVELRSFALVSALDSAPVSALLLSHLCLSLIACDFYKYKYCYLIS